MLEVIMGDMAGISLSEMSGVKLMNRIDTKFVAPAALLPEILRLATTDYYIQDLDGKRLTAYDTLYYDTPDLQMYLWHHNRHLRRQKIRIRTYIDSGLSVLEVKNKTNTGRTKKKRIEVNNNDIHGIDEAATEWLNGRSWYDVATLAPQLHTRFERITLVNKAKTERLTIDTRLRWENVQTAQTAELGDLVVIELKRDGNCPSEMLDILRQLRIKPTKMSKYCIGIALTNAEVKNNRFRPKLRLLDKMKQTTNE